MRILHLTLEELHSKLHVIGFAAENLHTRMVIDCTRIFVEYPGAVASMAVQPPTGDTYPATISMNGANVIWDITNSDLKYPGEGRVQLTFMLEDVAVKTYIGKVVIMKSLMATGSVPDPLEDFIAKAEKMLQDLEEAKESGEFDGPPGPQGPEGPAGADGKDGAPGRDGKDGADGAPGRDGADGKDGADGAPGADGVTFTPSVSSEGVISWTNDGNRENPSPVNIKGPAGPDGPAGQDATPDLIAVAYEDLTYPVSAGTLCYKGEVLYRAKQDIQTSESWTAGHWDATTVADELSRQNGSINANTESISDLQKDKAPIILDTASGSIATFPDGADGMPVEHCVVEIPEDESGITGCNVVRTGKNLFDKTTLTEGKFTTSSSIVNGVIAGTTNNIMGCSTLIPVKPSTKYYMSGYSGNGFYTLSGCDEQKNGLITWYGGASKSEPFITTTPSNCYYVVISIPLAQKDSVIFAESESAVDYEPFGVTYPISWQTEAGAIYDGGSIDLITGELTVNTDPVQTYQLDPVTITTLLGTNNIYADTGDVEVQYRADTKLFCDKNAPKVSDVRVNGTSIVQNGVASIPIANSTSSYGLVKGGGTGVSVSSDGIVRTMKATDAEVKGGAETYDPVVPSNQHRSAFYGIAKAAGDTTQASSSNAVGNYTENALSAISQMFNAPVSVSGTTPSITAKAGVRYVCGECATLDITAPASGDVEVIFESGSTATVLTVTPPTGVSAIKWANGFDPTSLDANTRYDLIITDGEWGLAASWT